MFIPFPKNLKYLISILFIFFANPAYSQPPSLIEISENAFPALVSISVENAGLLKSPQAHAAIDKRTGRMIIARTIRGAYYTRLGAGVIIHPTGIIVTNAHTVHDASKIRATLHNQTTLPAELIWISRENDIAFLAIKPALPLQYIPLADSNAVHLGNEVIVIGNSETLKQSILAGKIIGIGTNRITQEMGFNNIDLLQTDINIYKGDSGSALLNQNGELIGLMTAGQIKMDHSSFAVPSNIIKQNYAQFSNQFRKN